MMLYFLFRFPLSQTQNTKRLQHVTVSNTVIGSIIVLCLRGNNFAKATEILSSVNQSPHLVIGTITTECINEIFELYLAQAHVPAIFVSIKLVTTDCRSIYGNISLFLFSDASGIRYRAQSRRSRSHGQDITQSCTTYDRPRKHIN